VVQSVELTLDDAGDAAVRREWRRLAEAGVPSQARHTAPSNRPHVTLAALATIDPSCEPALQGAVEEMLPLEVRLGALAVFGGNQFVLARLVVPTSTLLELHARVATVVGTPTGTNLSRGRWTPHITLARRVSGHQLPRTLAVLGAAEYDVQCVAVRRWDGDARREWVVAGRGRPSAT
jgi:2'-5' RNA ligase